MPIPDGLATESLLPSSLPPAPLPSNSSDTENDLLQFHQPHWTNNKGKGRAIDVQDTDVAGSDSNTPPRSKKPGTLSHAALDDIHEFFQARFGVKPSQTKLNEANLFYSWDAINNIIMQEYNSLIKDILQDDTVVRREKLKHVYKWSENSSVTPANKSVKSITTRVQNTKTQFSRLAEAWSNLEEIEIIGVVMCLRDGSSSEARLLGSSAAGSGDTKRLELLSIWKYDKGAVSGSSQASMCVCSDHFSQVMQGIKVGDPQKIIWQHLLKFMMKNYLIILNWPIGVSLPGPGFEYKKLKADPLCKLLGTMYDGQCDDDKEQDSLDDVINMSESHHLTADSMVLHKVSDDLSWQKYCDGEDGRQGDPVDPPQQHQLPFPSHKQCHMEATNDDTTHQEDLQHDVPSHTNTQEHGSSQPLPQQHEDCWYECANYNDPGPSNVPYNHWDNRGNTMCYEDDFPGDYLEEDY
ncbi:hypothetical protein EDC04DRAFT_2607925 [Pisolithus marmoratus]|nr:hypothetical protein EDC04DRAFT_2607925 [Pisolithus marmoratus]